MLTDGDQIKNLLAEYCDLVDAGDLEGVGLRTAYAVPSDRPSPRTSPRTWRSH